MNCCLYCHREFEPTNGKRQKFCSHDHYVRWYKDRPSLNKGKFKKGHKAWNESMKGIHLSPGSEFKKGNKPASWRPVGTVVIREGSRRGRGRRDGPRAYVKIAEPNIWKARAVIEWERANGPLPPGVLVHHKDRNTLNDTPGNLVVLTRAKHIEEHRKEYAGKAGASLRKFWKKNPQKNTMRIAKTLRSRYGDQCADRFLQGVPA